jgi:hypothetical protein
VPHPSEEQSTLVGFPPGRHVRWAEIPAAAHVGRIRLDPAFEPGDYTLHSLEIRCESRGAKSEAHRLAGFVPRFLRRALEAPVAERFVRGRHVLDAGADLSDFANVRSIDVSLSTDGIVLRSLDDDPQVELPAFATLGRPMVVQLQATASIATIAQLFWATRRRGYCEEQSATLHLRPGPNVGYFAIPREALGRMRFDPASCPCEVVLHSLEIRAEA